MSTVAQDTNMTVDALKRRIADALGVHPDQVSVSIRSNDEWTTVDASIDIYKP